MTLNEIERRVLGVLLEKSLAQPNYYPMTLNAIVAGCNQKSNRNPVLALDDDTVATVLNDLRNRGLISMELPAPGARANHFKHQAETYYQWNKAKCALMAELLLRGPQTVGELRSRSSRMAPLENMEAVAAILDSLSQADPPMVATLPREPGQSTIRYTHLLYPEDQKPASALPAATSAGSSPDVADLRLRLEGLHAEVVELRDNMMDLRRRLESVEAQLA